MVIEEDWFDGQLRMLVACGCGQERALKASPSGST
jgi:hypothetical protein